MYKHSLPDAPVLITHPGLLHREAETLALLCREGHSWIHIRKPDASPTQIETLLRELQEQDVDFSRLTLHYHETLARQYHVGGVHLPGEALLSGAGAGLRRSCSTHSWAEVERYATVTDYLFLSPLFDSISKPGYTSNISLREAHLRLADASGTIVALGGVDAENITRVRQVGFAGAAVLGALWSLQGGALDPQQTLHNYQVLYRKWRASGGALQLISDGNLTVARQFLEGGGRWIQLRMKDTPTEVIISRGKELLHLCRSYQAVLLVNDTPQLAVAIGADGVHLGQNDMPPPEARCMVGEAAIIGSTANTLDQIADRNDGQTDYVGLGPFRFTTTKKNLSPTLGTSGYRTILDRMHREKIFLPVVAIGGITLSDVEELATTGVTGIALSGAITGADDPTTVTSAFVQALKMKHRDSDPRT